MNNDSIMDFDSPDGGMIDFDATPVAKALGSNPNIMDFDNPDVMDFDSPPAEPPAMPPSLSGASNQPGALPFPEPNDTGSVAFKEALEKAKSESALKAAGREAAMGVVPTLAGIGGGVAGGAALGSVAGPVGTVVGGVVGGIGAAIGAEWLQGKAISAIAPEQAAQLELDRAAAAQAHPYATLAGSLAPQLLVMKPSFKNVAGAYNAAKAIGKGTLNIETRAGKVMLDQLANVGIGAGVQGAQEAYAQYQSGDMNAGRLLAQIVAGAVINEPNKFGVKMGLNPTTMDAEITPIAEPVSAEVATPLAEVTAPLDADMATQIAMRTDVGAKDPNSRLMQVDESAWQRLGDEARAKAAQAEADATADRVAAVKAGVEESQMSPAEVAAGGVVPEEVATLASAKPAVKQPTAPAQAEGDVISEGGKYFSRSTIDEDRKALADLDARTDESNKRNGTGFPAPSGVLASFASMPDDQLLDAVEMGIVTVRDVAGKKPNRELDAKHRITLATAYQEAKRRGILSAELPEVEKYIATQSQPISATPPTDAATQVPPVREAVSGSQAAVVADEKGGTTSISPEKRVRYVEPEKKPSQMKVRELRKELAGYGVETTTRMNVLKLRNMVSRERNTRVNQERMMQREESRAAKLAAPVKVESSETSMRRSAAKKAYDRGISDNEMLKREAFQEQKIREQMDDGRYLNSGETVYDAQGNAHEVKDVYRGYESDQELGSQHLSYMVKNKATGEDVVLSGKDLTREAPTVREPGVDDVPFRTVLGESKGGDASRAKWIIRKTLGKDANVEIVDRIFEKGAERLGKYQKGLVTIAKGGNMERTAYHEAMHGAEDMLFTAKELDAVKRIMPDAEKRADAFMDYATGKQGVTGQVKMYFDRLMYRIKKLFGQADGISELKAIHAKLMQGSMAKRGAKVGTGEVKYKTPTAYDDVVKKFEAQEQANADKFKRKPGNIAKWFGRNWVSNTSPVEIDLRKTAVKGMQDWADPVKKIERDLAAVRGASGESRDAMGEASQRIFRDNGIKDSGDMQHFNRLAQARRVVEIDDLKRGQAAAERQRLIDLDKAKGKTDTHWTQDDEIAFQKQMTEDMSKSPISVDDAKAYIAQHETRADKARFDKAHDEYQKTYKALLKESLDAGIISKDVYDYIDKNHNNYQPRVFLDKIDPVIETRNGRGGTIEVRNSGLQTLKEGGEGALIMDSPHLLMSKIIQTKTAIAKNKATKSLADYLKSRPDALDAKIVTKMSDAVPAGKERIFYREDGKMQAVDVNRDFAEAWRTSNPQMTQEAMKIMRYASGTAFVKFLATAGNPEFAVANLPRDLGFTFLASKEFSPFMPAAAYQQLRNIAKQAISKETRRTLARYYRKHGGSTDFLSSMGHLEDFHNPGAITTGRKIANKVIEVLGYPGNTSEETVRLAHFQQALRNFGVTNFSEGNMARIASTADGLEKIRAAVYAASNVLDFRQAGNISKVVDQFVPFFNPAVQGARGVLRAFKDRPAETSFRASQIIGLGALLAMYNRKTDEKAWESTSEVEKDSKAVFVTGITRKDANGNERHVYVAPAIDQGWRPFFILGQMVGEKLMGKEVDPSRITRSIQANYVPYEASNLLPVVAALLTYSQNHDFWRNEKVWRGQPVEPYMERRATTPALATMAGDVTGMSPERLRAATGKMFPEHVASLALREAANKISGNSQNEEGWLSVHRLPFARKLLRLTSGRELTHDKELAAKRLGVKTQDKAPASILNEIEKAEKKLNTYRQKNNVTFDKMAAKVRSGEMTKADLYKAAWQVKNDQGKFDGKERVRLLRRIKERYPQLGIVAPSARRD